MRFEHVLVVGAGQMGGGIAQVLAASGRRVSLHDAAPGAVERGLAAMGKSLERLAAKGADIDPDDVLGRLSPVDGIVPADLMIEAVVEDRAVKEAIFREADSVLPAEAILASNTSSIPIASLAAATSRPDRVIGMHFFNPVPVMALVEVVSTKETSAETRGGRCRARAGARQDPRRGERLPRLRLEPRSSCPSSTRPSGRSTKASPSRRRSTRSPSSGSTTRWGRWRSPT